MNFKQWIESYGPNVIYLKQYMQSRSLDLPNLFYDFISWKGRYPIMQRVGVNNDQLEKAHDDGDDYDILARIEQAMTEEEKSNFIDHLHKHSSSVEAPTWSFFDKPVMLRPDTWLIHFTNSAFDIAWKGFTKGVEDLTKLGLTTYLPDVEKSWGGYNFAFVADSRDARYAARQQKYGKEAVMFQAAGVQAYHHGDAEDQVIFWGKSVNPNKIIYLTKNYDNWCVSTTRMNRDCAYVSEDFEKVVDWVINNHQQYRHKIAGFAGRGKSRRESEL